MPVAPGTALAPEQRATRVRYLIVLMLFVASSIAFMWIYASTLILPAMR